MFLGQVREFCTYCFKTLTSAFQSVRRIIHPEALVIQLIAFAHIESQLPLYLDAMSAAGYMEATLSSSAGQSRIWRQVPNRKWYCQILQGQGAAKEVLLIHRPA
jgi:hypothetical protein